LPKKILNTKNYKIYILNNKYRKNNYYQHRIRLPSKVVKQATKINCAVYALTFPKMPMALTYIVVWNQAGSKASDREPPRNT
jgi:hypothetical protein